LLALNGACRCLPPVGRNEQLLKNESEEISKMCLSRKFLILVSVLLMMSCASLPTGVHNFSVVAREPEHSSWTLQPLNGNADIRLVVDLPVAEGPANVVSLLIEFGRYDKNIPQATLSLADPRCSGLYSAVFSYQSHSRQDESIPLQSAIPWGKQLIVAASWRGSDHIVVTVNDNEPIDVPLLGSIDIFKVTAYRGSIGNAVLDYRVVEN